MPLKDGDAPFIVASVGVFGNPPLIDAYQGRIEWLISEFKKVDAIPQVSFIIPYTGYEAKLKSKLSQIATANKARSLMGLEHKYYDEFGINARNFVWLKCMTMVIARTVANSSFNGAIEGIKIIVDDKTMRPKFKMLFEDLLQQIPRQFNDIVDRVKLSTSPNLHKKLNTIQMPKGRISIEFDSPESSNKETDGLWYAHYLSSLYRNGRKTENPPTISKKLIESGYQFFENDLTDMLISPISEKTIKKWEGKTGSSFPII